MGLGTLIGIIVVIPVFYLIGRWSNSSEEKTTELKSCDQKIIVELRKPKDQLLEGLDKKQKAQSMIVIGIIVLLSFVFLIGPLENFADLRWEDDWLTIFKAPFTFLFGLAPIVLLLWPILGIALIVDGYKKYNESN